MTESELYAIVGRANSSTWGVPFRFHVEIQHDTRQRDDFTGQMLFAPVESPVEMHKRHKKELGDFVGKVIAAARADTLCLAQEVERLKADLARERAKVKQQQREMMDARTELERERL